MNLNRFKQINNNIGVDMEVQMIAMVTGASSGFGEAISRQLVLAGYKVIGTGRRAERLAALADELGAQFLPLVFDVQNKAATRAAIDGLPAEWREVDLLVNLSLIHI